MYVCTKWYVCMYVGIFCLASHRGILPTLHLSLRFTIDPLSVRKSTLAGHGTRGRARASQEHVRRVGQDERAPSHGPSSASMLHSTGVSRQPLRRPRLTPGPSQAQWPRCLAMRMRFVTCRCTVWSCEKVMPETRQQPRSRPSLLSSKPAVQVPRLHARTTSAIKYPVQSRGGN